MPPEGCLPSHFLCAHTNSPHCCWGSQTFISTSCLTPWFTPSSPYRVYIFLSNNRYLCYFELGMGDFNILNISINSWLSNHKLIEGVMLWPFHFLPWAFISFGEKKKTHSAFCQIPNFRVILCLMMSNSLSAFAEIWFATICFWTLWLGLAILKCHHLSLVVHLSGCFRNVDYLKIQEN